MTGVFINFAETCARRPTHQGEAGVGRSHGKGHVKTERAGDVGYQTKERLGVYREASRDKNGFHHKVSEGEWPCQYLDFRLLLAR